MTNLAQRIPEQYRWIIYVAFGLVGVVLGSVPVYFASAGGTTPAWVLGALAVYGYVGGAFGFTASANVPAPQHRAE